MIQLSEIRSLTDFKRNTAGFIERLKKTGRPQILTINGKAELVVQDAESYERLLQIVERAEAIEGICRGLESAARGEDRAAEEVLEEIRSKYDLRRSGS